MFSFLFLFELMAKSWDRGESGERIAEHCLRDPGVCVSFTIGSMRGHGDIGDSRFRNFYKMS